MLCVPSEDRSAWASAQSDLSFRCPRDSRLFLETLVKLAYEYQRNKSLSCLVFFFFRMAWRLSILVSMATVIAGQEPLYSRSQTDFTGTQQRQGPGERVYLVWLLWGESCVNVSCVNVSCVNASCVNVPGGFDAIWAVPQQNQQNDQRRLRSAWAFDQTDQSSLCAQWVAMGTMLLHADSEDFISRGGRPSLSESSLGAHIILLVLSCGGSFIDTHHPCSDHFVTRAFKWL